MFCAGRAPLSLPRCSRRPCSHVYSPPAATAAPQPPPAPHFSTRATSTSRQRLSPKLSPKACAVLNTPLKDCDPKTLELVVSAFTQHINQVMSPEAGITDPAAMFANLWRRISTALADTNVDASLSTTPQAVPATPADAAPDAPVASPHPPTPPTGPSAKHAPRVSAGVVSGPTASDQRAAQPPPPLAGGSSREADRCREADRWGEGAGGVGRSFRSFTQSFARRRPHHVRRCREFVHPRGVRDGLQCLPSPPRLCHAACTGPP